METGQRAEFFPVEWRSSLRLDEGMVRHITPYRIMGLRNLLNSSGNIFLILIFSPNNSDVLKKIDVLES